MGPTNPLIFLKTACESTYLHSKENANWLWECTSLFLHLRSNLNISSDNEEFFPKHPDPAHSEMTSLLTVSSFSRLKMKLPPCSHVNLQIISAWSMALRFEVAPNDHYHVTRESVQKKEGLNVDILRESTRYRCKKFCKM